MNEETKWLIADRYAELAEEKRRGFVKMLYVMAASAALGSAIGLANRFGIL